jgi:hypoxanthine phosphoribosyltransferase
MTLETANSMVTHQIEVIYPPDQIQSRIDSLAKDIARAEPAGGAFGDTTDGGKDQLLVIAILKGSFIFAADLIRSLHRIGLAPQVEFMTLSSYKERVRSSGQVEIRRDIETEVRGRDILLVDDILETGRTLAFAKDLLTARGARSVKTCVLLEKPGKRSVEIDADFRAFVCPDVFVVGYGMDLAHNYRQLPFVGRIIHGRT